MRAADDLRTLFPRLPTQPQLTLQSLDTHAMFNRSRLSTDRMNTGDQLSTTFAALADPTRRAILARLTAGEATVNELAEPFPITVQAVSKHLKVLERAGLIARGHSAQLRPSRLQGAALKEAADWLDGYRGFWELRIDRLDEHLREIQKGTGHERGCDRAGDRDHAGAPGPTRAGVAGVDRARPPRALVGPARLEHARRPTSRSTSGRAAYSGSSSTSDEDGAEMTTKGVFREVDPPQQAGDRGALGGRVARRRGLELTLAGRPDGRTEMVLRVTVHSSDEARRQAEAGLRQRARPARGGAAMSANSGSRSCRSRSPTSTARRCSTSTGRLHRRPRHADQRHDARRPAHAARLRVLDRDRHRDDLDGARLDRGPAARDRPTWTPPAASWSSAGVEVSEVVAMGRPGGETSFKFANFRDPDGNAWVLQEIPR